MFLIPISKTYALVLLFCKKGIKNVLRKSNIRDGYIFAMSTL